MLANITYNKSRTVGLTLPARYAKHLMNHLPNRMSSSPTYSNDIITGSLKKQELAVYKLTEDIQPILKTCQAIFNVLYT
ncbi:MAG TPA: hypothetical protein VF691_11790 [Cytophagaceae bacterium]